MRACDTGSRRLRDRQVEQLRCLSSGGRLRQAVCRGSTGRRLTGRRAAGGSTAEFHCSDWHHTWIPFPSGWHRMSGDLGTERQKEHACRMLRRMRSGARRAARCMSRVLRVLDPNCVLQSSPFWHSSSAAHPHPSASSCESPRHIPTLLQQSTPAALGKRQGWAGDATERPGRAGRAGKWPASKGHRLAPAAAAPKYPALWREQLIHQCTHALPCRPPQWLPGRVVPAAYFCWPAAWRCPPHWRWVLLYGASVGISCGLAPLAECNPFPNPNALY